MKVALIFAPYNHKLFEENLWVVSEEFGVYPPLNLAYVAAIIERAGHEVILIDANALRLSKKEVLEQVEAGKIQVKEVFTDIPSPFAFNLVLMGYADIMKMEDKLEFLRRMHNMVLAKIEMKQRKAS